MSQASILFDFITSTSFNKNSNIQNKNKKLGLTSNLFSVDQKLLSVDEWSLIYLQICNNLKMYFCSLKI